MDNRKTATLILRRREYQVRAGMTIRDALLKLEIPLEAVLAVRDGELVTEEEILAAGDVIKLVAVISGG